ncbi:hypothetical protein ACJMK2_036122 [Sinanodonta woodiana]|uniref:Uncharacterized protein n=1 Tax=Sinanodonta woodiana TaxID=1069815 RepID=A0ABD3WJR8_SINWO
MIKILARRTNKSLSRANKKIQTLDMKVKTLNTRKDTLRKKVQRLNRKLNKSSSRVYTIRTPQPSTDTETGVPSPTTPKSRAITEINQLNMTPRSRKKVRQKLLFQNCILGDTKEAAQRLKGKAKIKTMGVICGKLIHRYRMGRQISRSLGVHIKQLLKARSQCTAAHEELSNLVGKQVKGTIQVHAVIPLGEGSIAVRNTSCFCDKCFVDGQPVPACDGWTVHRMSKTNIVQNSEAEQTTGHDESEQQGTELMECNKINTDELYQVNTYVAAIYESRWYVGQVLKYDEDDQEYNINFMIWIPSSDVLCSLDEPIKQGKTRNMFKFSGRDLEKVRNLFDRL